MSPQKFDRTVKLHEIELHRTLVRKYRIRYESEFAQVFHRYWNHILTKPLIVSGPARVLDCGCGSGALLKFLNGGGISAWGVDLSADMVRELLDDAQLRRRVAVGDMEELPFGKERFDLVICRGSLHHVPNPLTALREIHGVLRPGGHLVVSEPCNDSIALRALRGLLVPRMEHFGHDHKAFRSKELVALFHDAGFEVESKQYFGYLGFPLCGLSDMIPVVRHVPGKVFWAKSLATIDRWLACVPGIRTLAWHVIIRGVKPGANAAG